MYMNSTMIFFFFFIIFSPMISVHITGYRIAIPPAIAAPSTPQAEVSKATDPAVDVDELEEPPLWGSPSAVDSLALSFADSPEKGVAMTLVLFLQEEGFSYSVLEENWISAHYMSH